MENKKNNIKRVLFDTGEVVATILDGKDLKEQIEKIHGENKELFYLNAIASVAGYNCKEKTDTMVFHYKELVAISDYYGNVKTNPDSFDAEDILIVMKNKSHSSVPLATGNVIKDITAYYALSEQIPTVIYINDDCVCYFVQCLPYVSDETLDFLEKKIADNSLWDYLDKIEPLDQGFAEYKCDCNEEKFREKLLTLSTEDLYDLYKEGDSVEVVCQYCGKKYEISKK
ncbi:MAG: Hsp33 family molecular chaperone HslO [Ruminococcus sp.]|jgi:hypothetical protein|nr:Hsp33 family molecular chaperone HslO [Ruminococcus sp.]